MRKKFFLIGFLIILSMCVLFACQNNITPTPDNGNDAQEDVLTEPERISDLIMWYDIDYATRENELAETVWYSTYTGFPGIPKDDQQHRSATPLLGLYNQLDASVARQHLYWIRALGCNVMTCDWTNFHANEYTSPYEERVYKATENVLQVAKNTDDFIPPKVYVTVRLHGDDFNVLQKTLDSVYSLYTEYAQQWYMFEDQNSTEKPLVVIFADHSFLLSKEWMNGNISFKDERFTIRWSNGLLGNTATKEENQIISAPYWLFWEKDQNDKTGIYETIYRQNEELKPEQMIAWASVWRGSEIGWDEMNATVNGMTTFERSFYPVSQIKPQTVLICRFNYARAWGEYPGEGLSLLQSTHIEPCEELGFTIYDNVKKTLYAYNGWEGMSPPAPKVENTEDGTLILSMNGYPQEYRISSSNDFSDSQWTYLNITDWIRVDNFDVGDTYYIQTRNVYGESEVTSGKILYGNTESNNNEAVHHVAIGSLATQNRGYIKLFKAGGYNPNEFVFIISSDKTVLTLDSIDVSKYKYVTITYGTDGNAYFSADSKVILASAKKNHTQLSESEILCTGSITGVLSAGELIIYGQPVDATIKGGWASTERSVTMELASSYNGTVFLNCYTSGQSVAISSIVFHN